MPEVEPGALRITVLEAHGLASRASSVRVSVRLDGELLGRSPAVVPSPAACWNFQAEAPLPGQPAELFLEVTRPGLLPCNTVSCGGCTLPVDASTQIHLQSLPVWDYQQQMVGSLLVSIQSRCGGGGLQGGLANRASQSSCELASSEGDASALLGSRSCSSQRLSRSPGALVNRAATVASLSPTQPTLPGALPNHVSADAPSGDPPRPSLGRSGTSSSLQGAMINRATSSGAQGDPARPSVQRSGTLGLQNQAVADAETGTRPNALPRARELLDGLSAFSPEDPGQCQALGLAVNELRHAPPGDLRGAEGEAALEACGAHVETLFRHALGGGNEEAAGRAIWLAGRLPQPDDEDPAETLQDRLRRDFHRHQMEAALGQADGLLEEARGAGDALLRLLDSLDLAESHATLGKCDPSPRLEGILAGLRPHVAAQLEALLQAGKLEEVEGVLNVVGARRVQALGLEGVNSKLSIFRGIDLLQSALTPAPGQIGFPMLKQRLLRHATMTARTALASEASAEVAGRLEQLLLRELLPVCLRHSCDSTLAALRAAFELLPAAEAVWAAVRPAYEAVAGERQQELAGRLPGACREWRTEVPEWMLSEDQKRCQLALRAALAGADAGALQAALVRAKEVAGARDLCAGEFAEALGRLRAQHRLPEGWNVESMLAGQAERKLLAKQELDDPRVVRAFDDLLKRTTNPVWTRDRRGRVTREFQAVRVVHVMNAETWAEYAQRRDEIASECSKAGVRGDEAHWRSSLGGAPMTKQPFEAIAPMLDAPPLLESVNEGWFLHGTTHSGAAAIASHDFDMARARPTGLYGAGIYLAESISKSDEYVEGEIADGVELFPLLICRVCLGNVFYCAEKLPNRRDLEYRCLRLQWHSVLGDRVKTSGTFREFIIYDPKQVFVAYIVYYKRIA